MALGVEVRPGAFKLEGVLELTGVSLKIGADGEAISTASCTGAK